jgi:cytochrome bd-type quinol oxidase subunit 1
MLRTADAVSPVGTTASGLSLAAFIVLYSGLFLAFFWYWLRIVLSGPDTQLPTALVASRTTTTPALLGEQTT